MRTGSEVGAGTAAAAPTSSGGPDAVPVDALPALRPRTRTAVALAVTAVALAPIVAVVVQRWGHTYLPTGDQATIDLRVRDVWSFSADTPLVGPFSRFGWSHPGPILFYLLALVSGLLGRAAWATLVGGALIQAAAVAWLARLAYATGGLRRLLPWMTVVALSYVAAGRVALLQVWNPYVALPFFALFLLFAWLTATGSTRHLLGLTFVATFLVQTHIGYVLPVALVGAWALGRLWWSARRTGRTVWRLPVLGPPALLAAVLWFPPLVLDPLLHPPGNTRAILHYLFGGSSGEARTGLGSAAGYLAAEFHWLPTWLGGTDPVDPFNALSSRYSPLWLLVPLALCTTAYVVAARRHRSEDRVLAELLLLLLPVTVLSIALVTGMSYPYLFEWRYTVGVATVVLPLAILAGLLVRSRSAAVAAVGILVVALVAGSAATTRSVLDHPGPVTPATGVVASLLGQLERVGQPTGPVQFRVADTGITGIQAGLVNQLSRQGEPVYVDPSTGFVFGYGKVRSADQVGAVWYVAEESQVFSLLSALPGATVLAVSHPLPPAEQQQLIDLQRSLAATLTAEGRSDLIPQLRNPFADLVLGPDLHLPASDLQTLTALNARVSAHQCLCGVIAFPTDRLPAALPPSN